MEVFPADLAKEVVPTRLGLNPYLPHCTSEAQDVLPRIDKMLEESTAIRAAAQLAIVTTDADLGAALPLDAGFIVRSKPNNS